MNEQERAAWREVDKQIANLCARQAAAMHKLDEAAGLGSRWAWQVQQPRPSGWADRAIRAVVSWALGVR